MSNTAPAPSLAGPPGMCPIALAKAGGADGGGAGGKGKKGAGGKDGGNGGNGPDGSSGAKQGSGDPVKYPLCGTKSHPVDVVTGRAHTHPIEDFATAGPLPLVFTRSCSSAAASRDFGLGWGWAHSFGWVVELRRDMVRVWTDRGVPIDFPPIEQGQEHLGPFGWVLRREAWGYVIDADDGVWRVFSVSTEGRRHERGSHPVLAWCAGEAYLLTAIEDRNKNRIELSYDEDTLCLAQVKDSAGREIRARKSPTGRIAGFQVKNALAQGQWVELVTYHHDDEGLLESATDADGYTARYAYEEGSRRLAKDTDRNGLSFHFEYWPDGRCRQSWGSYEPKPDASLVDQPKHLHDGLTPCRGIHHCLFEFGDDGFSAVTDSTQTSSFQGNDFGLIDEWNEGTSTLKATYRADGHLLSLTDGVGATTTYERDRRGRVTTLVDPLQRETRIDRDPLGLPTRIVDPAGGESVLERDGRGNLLWARDPLGNLTRYDRDPRGLLTAIYHPAGGITRAQWDQQGNLVAVQQPDGGVWRFAYDLLGRRLSATDPLGHATHYTYSPRGDLLAVRDALGQVTRYSYDGEGQLTQAVSPAGHLTKLEWGGYHKLVRRTDPNGNKVRLGYNVEGELTHVWNERGELHKLEYTSAGLLREEQTFDGRTLSYRHDQAGRPIAIRNGAGELTELAYDPAGQLIARKLHDDAEEKFTYSPLGDLVAVEAPGLALRFQRDALGQIVREEQTYGGQTHAVDVAYDPDGERIRRATSLGHVEEVQRDAAGHRRLTRLDGREIAHAVDLFGRELARQLPGGGRLESSFDALGRLADRRALGPERELPALAGQPEHLGPRRTNVSAYKAFRYDADGELIETIDRDRGRTQFRYDPVGQLLAMVPERARAELFRYDKTGNLHEDGPASEKRVYAKGNRLLQKGDTHYTWDRDGRLLEKRSKPIAPDAGQDTVWQYTWNAAGLLHRARSSDGTIVECAYDPFARRIEKRVYEQKSPLGAPTLQSKTRFVWDGDVLVHELREQGIASGDPVVEERTYWFEDGGFEPMAHREKRVDDVGRESGGWFHYKNDPIGTPERLVAEDGSVAAEYERKAWGQLEQRAGAKASTPIRLQGQYWDEETGLAYNRWRYYDGEGRFVGSDPIGLEGGSNGFLMGWNPCRWLDPFGLAGGIANVEKGRRGVAESRRKAADRGESIVGEEITLRVTDPHSGRSVRIRADLITQVQGPPGARNCPPSYRIIEAKNGPNARLTKNQRDAFKILRDGGTVVPVGKRAKAAGLEPGLPIHVGPPLVDPCDV